MGPDRAPLSVIPVCNENFGRLTDSASKSILYHNLNGV